MWHFTYIATNLSIEQFHNHIHKKTCLSTYTLTIN